MDTEFDEETQSANTENVIEESHEVEAESDIEDEEEENPKIEMD